MKCKQCQQEKPVSEFYKHPQMPSWYLNFCKECKRAYARSNRSKEVDKKRYWSSPKKRLNVIYSSMMSRCYNKNIRNYHRYGWRWIKVLWDDYKHFYSDMLDCYMAHWNENWWKENRQTQIDRIDNNWNYCKENCRWVTPKEQCKNRDIENNICYKK